MIWLRVDADKAFSWPFGTIANAGFHQFLLDQCIVLLIQCILVANTFFLG